MIVLMSGTTILRSAATAPDAGIRRAAWFFAAASALHVADHLRRGQGSVTELLYVMGNVALVLQIVTIVLVLVGHRRAALLAAVVGIQLGLGFFAAHWLPAWSDMSDPVWQVRSLRWLSYVASSSEIVGALWLGVAGVRVTVRRWPAP